MAIRFGKPAEQADNIDRLRSMKGARITEASIDEGSMTRYVRLVCDNGITYHIGVSGSLDDEAYLIFDSTPTLREPAV